MAKPLVSSLLLNRDISKCPTLEQEDLDVCVAAMEALVFRSIHLLMQVSDYPQQQVLALWHRVVSGSVGSRLLYRSEPLSLPEPENMPEESGASLALSRVKGSSGEPSRSSERLSSTWKQEAEQRFMSYGVRVLKESLGDGSSDTLVRTLRRAGLSREMYTQIIIDALDEAKDEKYKDYCGLVDRAALLQGEDVTQEQLNELVDINRRMHEIEQRLGADPCFLYGALQLIKFNMRQHTKLADRIGTAYLRLVVKNAQQRNVAGESQSPDDDRQNGVFGLIRAIRMYDHRTGARFAAYASYWIRQAIRYRAKLQTNLIRQPNSLWDSYNKLERARRELERKHPEKGQVTYQALSKATGMSLKQIEKVYTRVNTAQVRSLDFTMEGSEASDAFTLQDVTANFDEDEDSDTISKTLLSRIGQLIQELPEDEARVVALRFGLLDHLASGSIDRDLVASERIRQLVAASRFHRSDKNFVE
jgi:RNA polymerase sigma factor (sigma-70 family)